MSATGSTLSVRMMPKPLSVCWTRHVQHSLVLAEIDTETFCQLGVRWARSPATDLGEMPKIVIQDVW